MLIRVWPVIGSRYEVRIFGFLRFRLGGERERGVVVCLGYNISLYIYNSSRMSFLTPLWLWPAADQLFL